ncbi:decaprenyl-phosphate phosphoribosyltransferase [Candidatus Woesearchaeota archaeon]|nr:decaprenyl-phosphate phosphoribosyltransferase [Candidatus Woesearchaeota archaeon]
MITDLFLLLRPQQWYKNALVYLPLFFARAITAEHLLLTTIGFVALCFISSTNYIINDIVDIKRDRAHPEKRQRPLASQKIPLWAGIVLALTLFVSAVAIAGPLGQRFAASILFLFLFTQFYSFVLKHEVFADIIAISINFVIRANSGAYLIDVPISNWLVIGVFFFALFLASGKRHADLLLLKDKATTHKKTLKYYTPEITNALMIISTTILLFTYTLFTFLSTHKNLIYTIPFALYAILRYAMLASQGSIIARHPHYGITDIKLVISSLLWVAITGFLLYY